MSTAIYYNPEERHSLPSLSSIMNTQQPQPTAAGPAATSQLQPNGSISGQSVSGDSELFSTAGSQTSTAHTTPASSFSGSSSGSGQYYGEGKCSCKSNANRIPRPRNAFILFRQKYHQSVLDEGSVIRTNPEVSRELGRRWRALPNEERDHWNKLAEEEKTNHAKKFPGYRYTPRRNGKGKICDFCKQKNLRQQQLQLHNHQMLQLQQDQYTSYMLQQQQAMQQLVPSGQNLPPQFNQQYQQTPQSSNVNLQQPYNNMVYLPQNPIQSNFQFQYNNEFVPGTQEKLSPLSSMPMPYDHHYHHQQPSQMPQVQVQQGQPQQQPQFAIGYEQSRFNSLPTPVGTNASGYGFDYQS
ncbi:slightly ste11-like protein [Yamadazyma tenuis]|uniref:HMG box domain-containing protein n=1 Tax=Candida tenuis (strain ATCC 10573 / BCRC 21748 / CBS 615 / JCM 9827 / NBRC 10315 / NRRL Y-1498 / VKM Y-70) TaxID=590646 RepID=G3BBP7_CANTC|nr:uncharacterized protein CANTEDRAFT_136140 [Yamadazyma tenuis ATCC 10573]EGV62205.1 hypothetical protein CANTEDRAFT_136140 [Yamadazyma tenuis ATCC 10573]WEJ93462.1 slightly ste11-like protein [Yamadazyma tenuis]